jgi:replicative DNA helicase
MNNVGGNPALDKRELPRSIKSVGECADQILSRAVTRRSAGRNCIGMSTGMPSLDAITDGLEVGDFFVVASRPSMGKSALCLQVAAHVASVVKKPVAIFSYDAPMNGLAARIIGNSEQISGAALRAGVAEHWDKFMLGIENLRLLQLYLDAPCQRTLEDLIDCCGDLHASLPDLALILIDDVQGMMEQEEGELDAAEISRSFKDLATETGACVIAATQLSRQLDHRRDKRPVLRDLQGLGRLDLHADVVCGLYRDEYYDAESKCRGHAELIIMKNAKGPKGTIELQYDSSCCRFSE